MRVALIFRTHLWDDFVQRQFDRLGVAAKGCDRIVLVDETGGAVAGIPHDRVVRVTAQQFLDQGFARAGSGNLLWYNGDYPLYALPEQAPGYNLYVQTEYDAAINLPVFAFAEQVLAQGLDFVGLTKGQPTSEWFWLSSCTPAYPLDRILHQLICVSAFTPAAIAHLRQRRLAMSDDFRAGILSAWPMCEGFIPTELAAAGLRIGELSAFGDVADYDHWPPYLESDVETERAGSFVHPVLDAPRYVASLLKYRVGLGGYLYPNSLFHRKLRRLPAPHYARALIGSFAAKAARDLRLPGRAAA